MVTSIELNYRSDYSVAESASSNLTLKSETKNETLELPKLALIGIGIGAIAGFSISAFWYQKYRQRQLYLSAKIDRFIEEFSCGSLADYHLSKSRNSQKNSTTENQEDIPKLTNNQENLVNPNSSFPIDNIVVESTTEAIPNYLCDSYQKLIEEIVTTTLKGEISCQ